jgi:hypothetical protein
LIPPSQKVNLHDVIPWGECVTLTDASVCLLGPFNFQDPCLNPPGRSVRSRQYGSHDVWTQLSEICSFRGLRLPCLLPNLKRSASQSKKRKRT